VASYWTRYLIPTITTVSGSFVGTEFINTRDDMAGTPFPVPTVADDGYGVSALVSKNPPDVINLMVNADDEFPVETTAITGVRVKTQLGLLKTEEKTGTVIINLENQSYQNDWGTLNIAIGNDNSIPFADGGSDIVEIEQQFFTSNPTRDVLDYRTNQNFQMGFAVLSSNHIVVIPRVEISYQYAIGGITSRQGTEFFREQAIRAALNEYSPKRSLNELKRRYYLADIAIRGATTPGPNMTLPEAERLWAIDRLLLPLNTTKTTREILFQLYYTFSPAITTDSFEVAEHLYWKKRGTTG